MSTTTIKPCDNHYNTGVRIDIVEQIQNTVHRAVHAVASGMLDPTLAAEMASCMMTGLLSSRLSEDARRDLTKYQQRAANSIFPSAAFSCAVRLLHGLGEDVDRRMKAI